MKNIKKYILIFMTLVAILTGLLIITAKIPKEKIEKSIELSTSYLSRLTGINYLKRYHPITWLDLYADEKSLDIIYNIDTSDPLKSVMEARHYQNNSDRRNLKQQIENKELQANKEYLRYWHGTMIIIRPLLVFFSIHGIFIFNAIIMGLLFIILLILLTKKKTKGLSIAFLLAIIMTGTVFTPFCIEYSVTFMIMLIISILAIILEKTGNSKLYLLFFITGVLTCFFDFLTTELITVLVPILFVLGIRKKENKIDNVKDNIKFLLWSIILWFIGYTSMWFAKWILASIILKINAFDYIKENLLLRLGAKETNVLELYKWVIPRNLYALFPITLLKNKIWLIMVPLFALPTFIMFRKKKKIKELIPFFIIAILPYIRYLLLINHSYCHYFFMFREQFPTIMSLVLIFVYGMDRNKIFKKRNILNKGEKHEKRINNINSSTK